MSGTVPEQWKHAFAAPGEQKLTGCQGLYLCGQVPGIYGDPFIESWRDIPGRTAMCR